MISPSLFGSDLKSGDKINVCSREGHVFMKHVDYTSPFDCDPSSKRMYVYFTDGTNLQPDDGATYRKLNNV